MQFSIDCADFCVLALSKREAMEVECQSTAAPAILKATRPHIVKLEISIRNLLKDKHRSLLLPWKRHIQEQEGDSGTKPSLEQKR